MGTSRNAPEVFQGFWSGAKTLRAATASQMVGSWWHLTELRIRITLIWPILIDPKGTACKIPYWCWDHFSPKGHLLPCWKAC